MNDRGSEEARLSKLLKKDDPESVTTFLASSSLNQDEALALAAESCAQRTVSVLLAEGANPNASLPPALVRAIEAGCHEILDALHEAGADLGSEPWWEDGDHPLTSAAATADPIAMRWLCEKGAVEVAAPGWLWEALSVLGASRKKSAQDTLLVLGRHLQARLVRGGLRPETGPLNRAVGKLRQMAKTSRGADELASSLAQLIDLLEAEEDEMIEILDLADEVDLERARAFVQHPECSRRRRRAGLTLVYGIRGRLWQRWGRNGFEEHPEGRSFVEGLLEMDPDVHVTDDMGRTALIYAVQEAQPMLAQRLVDLGADLEAREWEKGESVLDYAGLSAKPNEMVAWVKGALAAKGSAGEQPGQG